MMTSLTLAIRSMPLGKTHTVFNQHQNLISPAFFLRHLKSKIENGMSQEATMEGLRNLYDYVFSNLSTL